MMRFKEFYEFPILSDVFVTREGEEAVLALQEGKWVSGRFDRNIRIDHPTHGAGQTHAHVLGRKGEQIGVVNFDGTASHGTKCRLNDKDAEALRAQGFQIPLGNVVEWLELDEMELEFLCD